MWNIALDGNGNPKLPGTTSCGGPGCRGLVTVNNDGSYVFNQECLSVLCCADTSNLYLSFQSMQWLRRPRLSYPKIQEALSAKELEFRLVDPRAGHFGWAHT
jgi:hypothetical protein